MSKYEILLADYCQQESQAAAAEIGGVTPGAVSQMIKNNRRVFVVFVDGKPVGFREEWFRPSTLFELV
jgi:predicted transcriptional regulator